MTENAVTTGSFAEQIIGYYEREKVNFPGNNNPVISNLRDRSLNIFAEKGFPKRTEEYYKYSPVQPLIKGYVLSTDSRSFNKEKFIVDPSAINVFIVDGKFDSLVDYTSSDGLKIQSLKENISSSFINKMGSLAKPEMDELISLNSLMFTDGVSIEINKTVEKPIHVFYVNAVAQPSLSFPRAIINVAKNVEATIIEHSVSVASDLKYFSFPVTEIFVDENARVDHYRIQEDSQAANILTSTNVIQKRDSFFSTHNFTLSGSYTRNNLNIALDDVNSEAVLNGLYIAHDKQHVDNHTFIDHRMPNCLSNELYKGVAAERSTGVFNGKIMVRQDAQKTNAYQSNKNILLSPDATINTKPQLEIYADDVKCSHGSSTGKIDPEALFYLQARGIGKDAAKRLMLHAFVSELTDNIKPANLKEYVSVRVNALLEK